MERRLTWVAEAIYKQQRREMSRPPRVADRLYAQGGAYQSINATSCTSNLEGEEVWAPGARTVVLTSWQNTVGCSGRSGPHRGGGRRNAPKLAVSQRVYVPFDCFFERISF